MAKRTDEQIAEHMRHYIGTPDKYPALEALARVEGKSETEIIAICEKQGVKFNTERGRNTSLSEEKVEEVKAALRDGLTLTQVAERCHVGVSTAGRIRVKMAESGEKLPKNVGGHKATAQYKAKEAAKADKLPEAYPGQINDEEPKPAVREDVKVFIPGEKEELERGTARACSRPSLWLAIRDSLSEFLLGTFGAGTEKIYEKVESKFGRVVIGVETPDGKKIRCILTEDDEQ